MKPTLTVIIPAYNEEGNIANAVKTVREAIGDRFADYEILIFDDGSADRTGEIADELARYDSYIKVIHNKPNKGFGYNYVKGVELAGMEYVGLIPGDNEISGDSIAKIFSLVGKADIVAPYTVNTHIRPMLRRIISRLYTLAMNMLFGLRLNYFNGPAVHRTELARSVPITTHGFAFLSEIMLRLIRSGHSYIEVPVILKPRDYGSSSAVKVKNILSVLKTVARLWWDVYVRDRVRYHHKGKAV